MSTENEEYREKAAELFCLGEEWVAEWELNIARFVSETMTDRLPGIKLLFEKHGNTDAGTFLEISLGVAAVVYAQLKQSEKQITERLNNLERKVMELEKKVEELEEVSAGTVRGSTPMNQIRGDRGYKQITVREEEQNGER